MDNEQLLQEMKNGFAAIGERLSLIGRRLDRLESNMATKEDVEATETRLLSAFWKWGQTAEIKLKALPLIEERLSNIESRMFSAEEKISNLQHPKAS